MEKRAKRAIVAGLLVFLMTIGGGSQVTEESAAYFITALVAGGIAACLVYLGMAKPEEVVEAKRSRGRPKKAETRE